MMAENLGVFRGKENEGNDGRSRVACRSTKAR